MSWLNYHHLYYFYTIADEGSIAKATKKLRLAQSTLSTQLSQFEAACNCQLFERKNRSLVLTETGKIIFDYAHEIFSVGREMQDFLRDQKQRKHKKVQIGVLDSIPKRISQHLVHEIVEAHEGRASISEGRLSVLLSKLKNYKLDLIITTTHPPDDAHLKFHHRLIGQMPVYMVGHPKWEKVRAGYPRSLTRTPFLYPGPLSHLRSEIKQYFELKHVRPKKVAEVQDIELLKKLALSGLGVAALPWHAIDRELEKGELVMLHDTPVTHIKLWMIAASRKVPNPVAAELFENFSVGKKDRTRVLPVHVAELA